MRKKAFLSLLLCTLSSTGALAQQEPDTDVFNGKWNVSIQSNAGRPQTAKLVLANFAGTWLSTAPAGAGGSKAKGCPAKKFPVTVQVSQAASLEFTAWGSQISPACPDISVTLRPVSDKLLEGTVGTGETIKLSRP